ncbi:hypothetical protein AZF08_07865 [Bacillus gaemokensis]|nr:hypothetical protein AZF08_07865 [Bacillus gaemokensis]
MQSVQIESGEKKFYIFLCFLSVWKWRKNKKNLQDIRKLSRNKLKFGEESFEIIKPFLYDKGKG